MRKCAYIPGYGSLTRTPLARTVGRFGPWSAHLADGPGRRPDRRLLLRRADHRHHRQLARPDRRRRAHAHRCRRAVYGSGGVAAGPARQGHRHPQLRLAPGGGVHGRDQRATAVRRGREPRPLRGHRAARHTDPEIARRDAHHRRRDRPGREHRGDVPAARRLQGIHRRARRPTWRSSPTPSAASVCWWPTSS